MAVDGCDDGNGHLNERPVGALEEFVLRHPLLLGHAVTFFQIAARAEDLVARAGENGAAYVARVVGEPAPQIEHVVAHLGVDGVGNLGAVQLDDEHMRLDHFEREGGV